MAAIENIGANQKNNNLNSDKTQQKNFHTDEVVRLDGVTFGYNGAPVLEDISLSVKAGDFLALIGPNGGAKSTLMKLMVGLLWPRIGEVRLFGMDVRHFYEWNRIGYVSQNAVRVNTGFPATVEEVVASGFYSGFGKLFDSARKREAVKRALDLTGIQALSRRLVGELSGGQLQKVFLAKALVKKPEALFLDEPTTGIDAASSREFYALLKELNLREGITVVVVTHDIGAAFDRAKKIGCVHGGKVYIHDNINEVTQEHIAEVLGFRIPELSAVFSKNREPETGMQQSCRPQIPT
ncbi:MAG: metal ABC transporter ATP-binding protein [Tepidanaerobacteraceae bacterium]|jgi:zinc transport system ATP-binding protein|nr:metal ABC transporter ATP-binding protein [Tepidanaerobacteraceae bacterium]